MEKVSKHFYRSEFACQCKKQEKLETDGYCGGRQASVDIELVGILEQVRHHFCTTYHEECFIFIAGPNRCQKQNDDWRGVKNSMHLFGLGVDFKVFVKSTSKQTSPSDVCDYLEAIYPDQYGIGRYVSVTHLDVGEYRRWKK